MTHCASSLKCPCVGDVVTQVVDLELENNFTSQSNILKKRMADFKYLSNISKSFSSLMVSFTRLL